MKTARFATIAIALVSGTLISAYVAGMYLSTFIKAILQSVITG